MKCIMHRKNFTKNKKNWSYSIRSLQELYRLVPTQLFLMIVVNIVFILISRTAILVNIKLINQVANYDNINNFELTYVIKLFLPSLIILSLLKFTINLKSILFERFYIQFISIIKFEYKTKYKIQKKCSIIDSLEYFKETIHENIHEAEVAGVNIFRLVQSIINQISTFINIVFISSVFIKINYLYIVFVLLGAFSSFLQGIVKGKNNLEFRKNISRIERKKKEMRESMIKPNFAMENKLLNLNKFLLSKYAQVQRNYIEKSLNLFKKNFKIEILATICIGLSYVIAYSLSIYIFMYNNNIGTFITSITTFKLISSNVASVVSYQAYINMFSKMVKPYFDLIEHSSSDFTESEHPEAFQKVSLENIIFNYPGSVKPTLKNLNLEIKKGEKVAIVGLNGSGKTTLSKVLLGLFKGQSGRYVYNDNIINPTLNFRNIFKNESVVFQNFNKYPLNIAYNIGISELNDYLNMRKILSILEDLEFNKNIIITEELGKEKGHRDLSEGQWQKLAIGRCIYKDSEFIVFDEPTSAIDPIYESQLYRYLEKMLMNKTGVIITHRMGSIKFVDKIIVMVDGKIESYGTHEELLINSTHYKRLWDAQKDSYIF